MTTAEAYHLSDSTSVLSALQAVIKLLAVVVIIALIIIGGSALILFVYNKRFKSTVQQHQDALSVMNQDLNWNITRRKAMETHYQTLFHVANDAIMICKGLVIIECNERAREMLKAKPHGVIGNYLLDISAKYQADGQDSLPHLQQVVNEATKGKQQFFQWTFVRNDGSEFPAEVSLKELSLNNERLTLMSIRDISKRTTAEQQLRQAQKMAAMGEMLGAIAHQWRQPLNILSTYISSLKSAYYNQMISREFVEKLVSNADTQIQFMSKTIDDFRQFFKPSKTKERFSLIKALENAVKLVEPSYRQANISIDLRGPESEERPQYSVTRVNFLMLSSISWPMPGTQSRKRSPRTGTIPERFLSASAMLRITSASASATVATACRTYRRADLHPLFHNQRDCFRDRFGLVYGQRLSSRMR